jgi:CHASE3 domain sensor protein
LILIFGLVALGLPIALVAQLGTVRTLNTVNAQIAQTRLGALSTAAVLRYQLDEETGIRGYAATKRRIFLEPYERARAGMPERVGELADALGAEPAAARERRALDDLQSLNGEWLRSVAEPVLAGARDDQTRLVRGKTLIDRFRADTDQLDRFFSVRYRTASQQRDAAIGTTTTVSVAAIVLIAIEVVVFGIVIARMRRELDREHGFVEALQLVASVRLLPPRHVALGTAYRSATRGTRIGGDVFDVYRLDADRTLVLIADVSGKGLTAAVDATFVRYAVRTIASDGFPPDEILRRFDALYRDANPPPESFVTMFVGLHDRRTAQLAYANAGHEACWVRRGSRVEMLPPTGPIVGLGGYPFRAATVALAAGEVLVLATDGLTEARDPAGTFAPIAQITEWIANAPSRTPQELVDGVVALATRWTRGRISDDLAVLAVEPLP